MSKWLSLVIPAILAFALTVSAEEKTDVLQNPDTSIRWTKVLKQSGLCLGIQSSVRIIYEEETRRELKGPFFKDYIKSVRGLHGWDDGDPFGVNYLGHPWMGGVAGRILVNNDPNGKYLEFKNEKSYWNSRLKALGWSAAYSTIFELSPVGEAAIGNIGGDRWPDGLTYCDLIVTPVLGAAVIIGEDAADSYVLGWVEQRSTNGPLNAILRTIINPSRSFSNLLRFKLPWYRDNRNRGD